MHTVVCKASEEQLSATVSFRLSRNNAAEDTLNASEIVSHVSPTVVM